MKSSARNHFVGVVKHVKSGPVSAEVVVGLGGGAELVAVITSDSASRLGLAEGKSVHALVKASQVILTQDAAMKTSARNKLCGKVSKCVTGPVNAEVVVALDGGAAMTAVITHESVDALGIAEGGTVCALVKASSVILAVD